MKAATLTFLPVDSIAQDKEPTVLDGYTLSDLLVCEESGKFFTATSAIVQLEPQSSHSARIFYCPRCDSALRVNAFGERPVAHCVICSWDTDRVGVQATTDLLRREADPFPEMTKQFRRLSSKYSTEDSDSQNSRTSAGSPTVVRTASSSFYRARMGLPFGKEGKTNRSITEFIADETEKEDKRRGFRKLSKEQCAERDAYLAPPNSLLDDVQITDIVPLRKATSASVWLKGDLAPMRQLARPRVVVKSPYTKSVVSAQLWNLDETKRAQPRNAAIFMPCLNGTVNHDCENGGEEEYLEIELSVHNVAAFAVQLNVFDYRSRREKQLDTVRCRIEAGSSDKMKLRAKGVAWPYGNVSQCTKIATLHMSATFQGERTAEDCNTQQTRFAQHMWQCVMFVTHSRV